jgi:uncharacterized SAM-binding protein YcdF (DUF218 family)
LLAAAVHAKRPRRRRALLVLAGLGLALAAGLWLGIPRVGRVLVAVDPPGPADAIFVLAGATPARELGAAAVYHLQLAPRVVISRAHDSMASLRELAGEGTMQDRAVRVLAHRGVPPEAIVALERVVDNTAEELAADFDYAHRQGFRRIILITSPAHTRRVRIIWHARYQATMPALVLSTAYQRWDPDRWWRSRDALGATVHELTGIAHFYMGSPLPTFDRTR